MGDLRGRSRRTKNTTSILLIYPDRGGAKNYNSLRQHEHRVIYRKAAREKDKPKTYSSATSNQSWKENVESTSFRLHDRQQHVSGPSNGDTFALPMPVFTAYTSRTHNFVIIKLLAHGRVNKWTSNIPLLSSPGTPSIL